MVLYFYFIVNIIVNVFNFLNDYLWLNKRKVHSSFSMKRKKQQNCFKSNGMFICLCFSSPNMKQSQEKKKLFTLFCAMWHQSIQPSERELTASLYTHTYTRIHTHADKQEAPMCTYCLLMSIYWVLFGMMCTYCFRHWILFMP